MSQIAAVESPIYTYEHPRYENQVDLVGTVHIAEPGYYQEIQEYVDARADEGAVVHYELTKTPSAEELAAAPRAVRRKVERLIPLLRSLYSSVSEIEGLVPQIEAMTLREEWQNHDSTLLEQVADMSRLTIDGLWVATKVMRGATRILGKEEMQALMLQQLSKATSEEEYRPGMVERLTTIGRNEHNLHRRNRRALAAFDKELEDDPAKDIVLLWGAAHLKELRHRVEVRGFVQTAEQRLVAIHLDSKR